MPGFYFSSVDKVVSGGLVTHTVKVECENDPLSSDEFDVVLPCESIQCDQIDLSGTVLTCGSPGIVDYGNAKSCCPCTTGCGDPDGYKGEELYEQFLVEPTDPWWTYTNGQLNPDPFPGNGLLMGVGDSMSGSMCPVNAFQYESEGTFDIQFTDNTTSGNGQVNWYCLCGNAGFLQLIQDTSPGVLYFYRDGGTVGPIVSSPGVADLNPHELKIHQAYDPDTATPSTIDLTRTWLIDSVVAHTETVSVTNNFPHCNRNLIGRTYASSFTSGFFPMVLVDGMRMRWW